MQLVASSKMKRAQDRALQGRPYAQLLAQMMAVVEAKVGNYRHPYLEARPVRRRGVLLISTDRGLTGPLNANLFRAALDYDRDSSAFVTIGRKGRQWVARTQRTLLADFSIREGEPFREFKPVVDFLLEAYSSGEIDTVEVLFSYFKNTLIQEPRHLAFLPLVQFREDWQALVHRQEDLQAAPEDDRDFLFEPSPKAVLDDLLERFVRQELFQRLLSARASEHSARMVAMKAATDNAKKLSDSLTLQYNKARQAGITQEILEITAAAQHS